MADESAHDISAEGLASLDLRAWSRRARSCVRAESRGRSRLGPGTPTRRTQRWRSDGQSIASVLHERLRFPFQRGGAAVRQRCSFGRPAALPLRGKRRSPVDSSCPCRAARAAAIRRKRERGYLPWRAGEMQLLATPTASGLGPKLEFDDATARSSVDLKGVAARSRHDHVARDCAPGPWTLEEEEFVLRSLRGAEPDRSASIDGASSDQHCSPVARFDCPQDLDFAQSPLTLLRSKIDVSTRPGAVGPVAGAMRRVKGRVGRTFARGDGAAATDRCLELAKTTPEGRAAGSLTPRRDPERSPQSSD